MASPKKTRVAAIVGSLLVFATVSGCGGGDSGRTGRAGSNIRGADLGGQQFKRELSEVQGNLVRHTKRQLFLDEQINAELQKIARLDGELAELSAQLSNVSGEAEQKRRIRVGLETKRRARGVSHQALQVYYGAVQGGLNSGLQLRQRLSAEGALDNQSVSEYELLGRYWIQLRALYVKSSGLEGDKANLKKMEALMSDGIRAAAQVEPEDAAGRERISQSRVEASNKIKSMLE